MKITKVETIILQKEGIVHYDAIHTFSESTTLITKIFTDEDITGYATTHFGAATKGVFALKEIVDREIAPVIISQDPMLTKKIRRDIWEHLEYHGVMGLTHFGISAIDIALWDIKGKYLKEPVHKILGGAHNKIPAYAMVGWFYQKQDLFIKALENAVDEGFKAIKLKVGRGSLKEDLARIKLAQETVGEDIKLMVDANQALTEAEAIRRGRAYQEMGLYWFEEPLAPQFKDSYGKLASVLDIPIATGENEYTKYSFLELLKKGGADILQPDNRRSGGVTEWMEIGALADAFGVKVASHGGTPANVNMLCAMPNALFLETGSLKGDSPYKENLILDDGYVLAPKSPGMGTEVKEEWIEKWRIR